MNQEQLIRSIYDAANKRDMNQFLSFFAPDGQFKTMDIDTTYRGRNEIQKMAENWLKAFPDGKFVLNQVMGSGDHWSVEMSFVGTHQGPLDSPMGEIPASGKKVNVPACDVLTLRNGKVQSLNCYLAGQVLMNQIGQMPGQRVA